MRGEILSFDKTTNNGLISGHDGARYHFVLLDWQSTGKPYAGQKVDFEIEDKKAKNIIAMVNAVRNGSHKTRVTAAVLAFFLGGLGAHKFYLGQVGLGVLYLLFFWTFIPALVAFIEFILFLCMSDETFDQRYNAER